MAAMKYGESLAILRSTARELAKVIRRSGKQKPITEEPAVGHMLGLMRDNQVTEQRYCRPKDHYKYFAQTYDTYLRSARLQEEITQKYFNKEERSTQESARLVGLELPKQFEN